MRYYIHKILVIWLIIFPISFNSTFAQKQWVTSTHLIDWVSFLAADQMLGRRDGTPEMRRASEWISEKYYEMGLNPVKKFGGFFQDYSYTAWENEVNERNVIGIIEGSDPDLKDEYIILSAHYDHIGVGMRTLPDSIYNGADDNASGTATLIGIAKAINDSGLKPGRSVIFAAFSGEENGMRGSRYFIANSPVPLNNIYANLNFEMIGHSEYLGKNKYYMTGCLISDLDNQVKEYNKNTEYELIDTVKQENVLFNYSDNIAFSKINFVDGITKGIPSGTFATTTIAPYIHSVSDEVSLFDFDNMAGLINYFSELVVWLSKKPTEVIFTDPLYKKID